MKFQEADIRNLHKWAEQSGDVDQVRLCCYALGWLPCSEGMKTYAREQCVKALEEHFNHDTHIPAGWER